MYNISSLITKSLRERDTQYLRSVRRELLDDLEKKAVDWITKHENKHGEPPSLDLYNSDPDRMLFSVPVTANDSLEVVFESALGWLKSRYGLRALHVLEEQYEQNGNFPVDLMTKVSQFLQAQQTAKSASIFTIDRDSLYNNTELGQAVFFGFDSIDDKIGGILPGEISVWAARPGVGKSIMSVWFGVQQALKGKKVGLVSTEMLTAQLVHRIDAILGKFNPSLFRKQEPEARKKLANKMPDVNEQYKAIANAGGNIVMPQQSTMTVGELHAFVEKNQLDVLIVDGIYLLSAGTGKSQEWANTKAVSNAIKNDIAMRYGIPVVATTQLNRNGAETPNLESIAYSDAIGQDADSVVVMQASGLAVACSVIKNRNGQSYGTALVKIDWNNMTITSQEVDLADIELQGNE